MIKKNTFKQKNTLLIFKLVLLLCILAAYPSSSVFAIENAEVQKCSVTDTVLLLWPAEKGRMVLNEDFLKNVTDLQRAALGYIATECGNDCRWDGPKNADGSNLNCQLLTALNLGYMCSSQHLSFLRKWFSGDKESLEQLQHCSKRVPDYPIIDKFTYMTLISDGETLTITYEAKGANFEDLSGWRWVKETVFQAVGNNNIKVAKWKNLEFERYKF